MDKKFIKGLVIEYYGLGLYTDKDLELFVPDYLTEEEKQELIKNKKTA